MPFAELAACRVRYEDEGAGDAVLLVCGLGADHRAWGLQADALRGSHRVVRFDNPGAGETTGTAAPLSTELFADVAAGLLDHLRIERAHVVGASMGGAIAQQLALRHPERVRSLALHCTWGRADNHLAAILRGWQVSARALPYVELCRQVWPWVFTVWWYNDHPERLAELEADAAAAPQPAEAFCAQAEACIRHDALEQLYVIDAPTLLTVGDRDCFTPAHHTYAIKDRMPGARVRVWQKMGHAPFWEIPDDFNQVMVAWLEEH